MSATVIPLPVLDRPLDNTALGTFMECEKKFEFSMLRHRRERHDGGISPSLNYGTVWHKLLATHYRTGGDHKAAVDSAVKAWQNPVARPDDHRTLERLVLEYDNYMTRWGATPDKEQGQTVGFPHSPMVEIISQVSLPGGLYPYTVKLDRIIEINGHYYVEDHKTTSALGPTFFKQFELDNQMMGYAYVGGLIIGQPVAGVRVNAHGILKTQGKFERETIPFTPDRLKHWLENYNLWFERVQAAIKSGRFTYNWTACHGKKYGPCQYVDVCSMPARLHDRALEQDFDEKQWNPLEEDEEE